MPTCLRLICLVVMVLLGCRHEDPYFCENAPRHNCLAIDAPQPGCTGDQDCTAPTAVCDIATNSCVRCTADRGCTAPMGVCDVGVMNTCVQCTAAQHDACVGNQPVCGNNQTCRGCTAHTECPMSLACLPDGSCGTDGNVAYVDPAGSDNDTCSHAMPCTVVAKALATGKPFVKFQGATSTTNEAVVIEGGRQVTFLADPGARLTRPGNSGAIVTVQDDATSLSIYDLTISDAPNAQSGIGCVIPTGGGASTLAITRVRLANNPGGGISAAGGTVTISQSTITGNQAGGITATGSTIMTSQSMITGNQGIGISAMGGTTTVSHSMIIGNRGGGVSVTNGTFNVTSNFIGDNGDASVSGSDFGGLSLTGSGAARLEFNTIAYNHAKTGTLLSAGVACSVAGLMAPSNLITSNNEGVMFPAQTKGVCTFGNSYIVPGTADNTLGFRSTSSPLDLHLTAGSPALVVDAAGTCTGKDIDGDARPIGGACDLGADERSP
jgi:hypothetical protein